MTQVHTLDPRAQQPPSVAIEIEIGRLLLEAFVAISEATVGKDPDRDTPPIAAQTPAHREQEVQESRS